uniref:G-protein coupled receptors family 1 profile domain-containing protein n=1 Tax=Strongyloides venezuelensis TaxID=75913 RepID=A0A0K0FSX0_STRVS
MVIISYPNNFSQLSRRLTCTPDLEDPLGLCRSRIPLITTTAVTTTVVTTLQVVTSISTVCPTMVVTTGSFIHQLLDCTSEVLSFLSGTIVPPIYNFFIKTEGGRKIVSLLEMAAPHLPPFLRLLLKRPNHNNMEEEV